MLGTFYKPLLIFSILPICEDNYGKKPMCSLDAVQKSPENYGMAGDVIIGGMLRISLIGSSDANPMSGRLTDDKCTSLSVNYIRHMLAFMFAIEEINNRTDLLPNITLGYHIYDTCTKEYKAVQSVMNILSNTEELVPNYDCHNHSNVVGFVGHLMTSSSLASALLTGIYHYPQISYGAMDSVFSNKFMFPSFYRTVPDIRAQGKAIVLLLKHFDWSWVGIVSSENESSKQASTELQRLLVRNGICIEFAVTITEVYSFLSKSNREAFRIIARSSCNVVILYSDLENNIMMSNIESVPGLRKVFILFANFFISKNSENVYILNGSLLLHLHSGNIPHLQDYLLDMSPLKYPRNFFLHQFWRKAFNCLPENLLNVSKYNEKPCIETHDLRTLDPSVYDVESFRFTFSIYSAVQALAQAVHDMSSHRPDILAGGRAKNLKPWQINNYLKRVNFTTTGGEQIQLDDRAATLDLLNVLVMPDRTPEYRKVGAFYLNRSLDYKLQINTNAIQWIPKFTKTPRSVCTETCLPGYQRLHQQGRQICCNLCIPCPEGEITNTTGMEKCVKCPMDQWSNERRDTCIQRATEFLSYGDALGISLLAIALLFCFLTGVILGIFITYKDTAMVKANNRNLSFILLLSLILSFLCPLLFIGCPTKMSCLLRQVAFGNIFTVAVSSILGKTLTVILAFKAIKPHKIGMEGLGNHSSRFVLLICSSIEALTCVFWLSFSPPFPEYNSEVEVGKIILQCNEGSAIAFYMVIGFIGFLAILSFIVAFLARKLPDTFNEAQYITFSMLVFCSVWISFIPAYLSTKGKYMVAVEVFSIEASSAGLLSCIFIPKCYIILLRPELNTKTNLIRIRFNYNKNECNQRNINQSSNPE